MAGDILAFDPDRTTNAQAIAEAAQLGWLPEPVFDATHNSGKFWADYQPESLTTNDIAHPADYAHDWTEQFPLDMWGRFGAVVFDPDYKLQGTASKAFEAMNRNYGVDVNLPVVERLRQMRAGAKHCADLVVDGGFLLVKCQDQIEAQRFCHQTRMFLDLFDTIPGPWRFVSWLHVQSGVRPQRSQANPRNNYSTLMAFQRRPGGTRHPKVVAVETPAARPPALPPVAYQRCLCDWTEDGDLAIWDGGCPVHEVDPNEPWQ